MADFDPLTTQRDPTAGITAELGATGFEAAEVIGRGGFGVVYPCRQRDLERTVAVKVLTSDLDEENLERFLREQRAMGRLSGHPNIVTILLVGLTPSGRPYLVMPYHPLDSLDVRVRRDGPLEWSEALRIGVKLAGALESAHRHGTLHRDVKPANILLSEYGDPQLTDFGIARITGGFETSTGTVTGSPAFTAPEVLEGRPPTVMSDVYGLGATLFCLVTGHAAFERRIGEQVVAQFLRITSQPIPDLRGKGIPDDVSAAIERAMAREPSDRPATAAEFGNELREAQRRNGLRVDTMALPADSPVESRGEPFAEAPPRTAAWVSADSREARRFSSTTPPAPSTKFRPPTPTRPLVARDRLIEMLRGVEGRRLIVIHAPAGFGKSTLAAQWGEVLTTAGVPVAWLSIDNDDNNVVWFLAHLIEAIRRVRPTLAAELGQALEEHGDQAERYVLTSLIDEIHDSDERVAVVIDDWHRVSDAGTIAALGFLLDHGCHHLQIVVTSRTQTGLPLSRLRVRDELIEIDSAALRFTLPESRSFLVDLGGLELENQDVAYLRDSTDGWVAALQLASLSLRGREHPTELIGHLSGQHHAIGEFLAENVLEALEPNVLEFLLATSVTERICGSLATALTNVPRGQAMLEEIEERDLFLSRVDDNGRWFRYHNLFAEFLRRRLEREHPERTAELHRTASKWYAEHKHLSEAVDHALAAGDQLRAVELIEQDGIYLLEHSQMATMLGLVAKLPSTLVVTRPRLQIAIATANVLLQRAEPTLRALELVHAALDRNSIPDAESADLRAEAAVLQGVLQVFADRMDGVEELVSECLSRPETLRPWVVSVAADVATAVEIYRFDFAAARRWQNWAARYHPRTGGPFSAMYGYCLAGIAAYEQLDVAAAEDCFRTALELATTSAGHHSYATRLASALLGDLLYDKGDIAEAERLLDASYELGSEGGAVDFMLATYGTGARIKALRGDLDAAKRKLDEGASIADALSIPRLRARIDSERVRCGLPALRRVDAPRSSPDDDRGMAAITAEIEEATAIRVMLTDQPQEEADRACARAQILVHKFETQGRPKASLQGTVLLAACLSAAGRIAEAENILAPAVARCAQLGLVRVLLDGGPRVASLITTLEDDHRSGRWRPEWPAVPGSFLTDVLAAEQTAHRDPSHPG